MVIYCAAAQSTAHCSEKTSPALPDFHAMGNRDTDKMLALSG
ncbi:Uncharacterized protein YR821_2026 [Yersinia ruckeri]|uniref:Uncharacterized protein n=1 Tax=Yersinia ruckeri TaxID=29486 RepID=A0A0A8VE44_YERRU|nr:hypothetical protein yruck0001_11400 [Yersinia ruckeri ATCC 29473]QTD76947.1 Uncharacterized protein YR821_2026 [Yersinia ruckeri]CEK27840.1 hypothetical protein CSF007_10450 [Yersinia ruckeri]